MSKARDFSVVRSPNEPQPHPDPLLQEPNNFGWLKQLWQLVKLTWVSITFPIISSQIHKTQIFTLIICPFGNKKLTPPCKFASSKGANTRAMAWFVIVHSISI